MTAEFYSEYLKPGVTSRQKQLLYIMNPNKFRQEGSEPEATAMEMVVTMWSCFLGSCCCPMIVFGMTVSRQKQLRYIMNPDKFKQGRRNTEVVAMAVAVAVSCCVCNFLARSFYGEVDSSPAELCRVLLPLVLLCFTVLYCAVLYCTVLCSTILYCIAPYCTVLYGAVLHCTVLYCTVLYCTVLYCTVLYCTVLYCTVLYCTVLYCTVLCCAVLYCTVLYCAVLCCAVLCCTVLYCTVLSTVLRSACKGVSICAVTAF